MSEMEMWIRTPLFAAVGWTLFHSVWGGWVGCDRPCDRAAHYSFVARPLRRRVFRHANGIIAFGVTLMVLASRQDIHNVRTYFFDNRAVLNGSLELAPAGTDPTS
jgi:hypothetical protein